MSKCISLAIAEAAALEQSQNASNSAPLHFSPEREKSPLLRALRSHFERYQGLTEPRIEHIDSLRPQTDDL